MSSVQPVSPPYPVGADRSFKCYVESDGQLYEVFWEGSSGYPDFSCVSLHHVELSTSQNSTWSCSRLLDFGSGAIIRILDEDTYPVVKIAHPTVEARSQIQHEYNFIQHMADCPGIVKVHSDPLTDGEGVYGFRMELLFRIDFQDVKAKSEDVRKVVEGLHALGYCHGDLSPSNVMLNKAGQIVLIDFSFSGSIGQKTPSYVPSWAYSGEVFGKSADEQALKTFF